MKLDISEHKLVSAVFYGIALSSFIFLTLILVAAPAVQATTIEVADANGNTVTDHSGPNAIKFEIEWRNMKSITLDIHINDDDTSSILTLSGTAYNRGSEEWNGFHIVLGDGALWQDITKTYVSYGVRSSEGHFGYGSISGWDERLIKENTPIELFDDVLSRALLRREANIHFAAIPSPGHIVLGPFRDSMGHDRGSGWLIDVRNQVAQLEPGNTFTIQLQPTSRKAANTGTHP